MQKYIFFWVMSSGYIPGYSPAKFSKEYEKPHTMCGSDGIFPVDGRWGKERIRNKALELAKSKNEKLGKGIIGYSVGYLNSHDPKEEYSQRLIPLTFLNVKNIP